MIKIKRASTWSWGVAQGLLDSASPWHVIQGDRKIRTEKSTTRVGNRVDRSVTVFTRLENAHTDEGVRLTFLGLMIYLLRVEFYPIEMGVIRPIIKHREFLSRIAPWAVAGGMIFLTAAVAMWLTWADKILGG